MDTLIEFFTDCYRWTPEKAEEMAAWMSQVQTGADLERKQSIAKDFQYWQLKQARR